MQMDFLCGPEKGNVRDAGALLQLVYDRGTKGDADRGREQITER